MIVVGRMYWEAASVTMPSKKTEPVCVSVTMVPRAMAWYEVPREPTRYAATTVLPCPGVNAWSAPNASAINKAKR